MATEPTTERPPGRDAELEALKARLAALEEELADRAARTNAALAAAQDRVYWLERWHLDLNSLMRRPAARALRVLFFASRFAYRLLWRLRGDARFVGERYREATLELGEEEERAERLTARSFARSISPDPLRSSEVTDLLYARLGPEEVAEVERRLSPADRALWETADPADRRRLALSFGVHYGVEPVLERTGLSAEMPPQEVHSMARGAVAAGGSPYYADLVMAGLRSAGGELRDGASALDFGCSSGRVVRVLAAAYPEVEWHGCDPIGPAIEWARRHLPAVEFAHSPESPPLPYGDASFDFVFAISIWSHFSEAAALAWLEEMGRILRPGGHLLLTTHGSQTLAHDQAVGARAPDQLQEIERALYDAGFWFKNEFGEAGDHGIRNPDWGTAFLTPEWLLKRATPRWEVVSFASGRVEDNQDLFVLRLPSA
jgi:SAM-dependent methyltransferase